MSNDYNNQNWTFISNLLPAFQLRSQADIHYIKPFNIGCYEQQKQNWDGKGCFFSKRI